MNKISQSSLPSLFVFIIIAGAVQFIGSFFAITAISGDWYPALAKPFFNPPDWLFAPVWSILYLLIALAGWLVWNKRDGNEKAIGAALTIYAVQLFLNAMWPYLFFGSKSPLFGLAAIIALWLAILFNIISFYRISKSAGYLLVPYIFWVSFLAMFNFAIWRIN